MRRPRAQRDLFDDGREVRTFLPQVAVPRGGAPLGKEQKAFNRIAGRVRRLREELRLWDDYATRYAQRLANEIEPVRAAVCALQRRLVLRLDALLRATARGERLGRAQRRAVREHVVLLAAELLAAGPDAEIEALHDAHAGHSHAEQARAELEEFERLLADALGEDVMAGHDADDADAQLRHARERLQAKGEAESAEAEGRARRTGKRASRAELAAARKAAARAEALGTVRAIYRKLASAVHPDREPDPELRARKTVLMQRANEAHERADVLALLELQLELEQVDSEHLASTPAKRLEHFITVMKEQAAALEEEIESRVLYFRMLLERPFGRLTPEAVDAAIDADLRAMRTMEKAIAQDLERFDDPLERRLLLDELTGAVAPGDGDPFVLLEELMRAEAPPPRRRPRKKAKRRRGKR